MNLKMLIKISEIEEKIKKMNKCELIEFMARFLEQAKHKADSNEGIILHCFPNIKRKLQSIENELFILEIIGIKNKKNGKEYLLKEIDAIKNRIENLYMEE